MEGRTLHSHLIEAAFSQRQWQAPEPRRDAEVAIISAKITETLAQFDAQLLAAQQELEVLRHDQGHGRAGFEVHNAPDRKVSENEPARSSPEESSVTLTPGAPR